MTTRATALADAAFALGCAEELQQELARRIPTCGTLPAAAVSRHKRVLVFFEEKRQRWRVRITDEQGRIRVASFGCNEAAARSYAADCGEGAATLAGKLTQEQAVELYRKHLQERVANLAEGRALSPLTAASYLDAVRAWVTPGEPVEIWTPAALAERYEKMARSELATATHHLRLRVLRLFCKWLVAEGHLKRNPAAGIKSRGTASIGKTQMDPTEATRFLALAYRLAAEGDDAAIACALTVRCRLGYSEIVKRVVGDFDAAGLLFVRQGKTRHRIRAVPVPAELLGPMRRLCRDKLPTAYLFAASACRTGYRRLSWLNKAMAQLCKQAGVKCVTSHGGRATGASLLRLAGLPIAEVARQMGHSGPAVTSEHYVTASAEERAASDSLEQVLSVLRGTQTAVPGTQAEKANGFTS